MSESIKSEQDSEDEPSIAAPVAEKKPKVQEKVFTTRLSKDFTK